MASLLTHPIVPITAAALVGRSGIVAAPGAGFFRPWSGERIFFGLRPIWVWTPLLSLALLGYLVRSRFSSCASR